MWTGRLTFQVLGAVAEFERLFWELAIGERGLTDEFLRNFFQFGHGAFVAVRFTDARDATGGSDLDDGAQEVGAMTAARGEQELVQGDEVMVGRTRMALEIVA